MLFNFRPYFNHYRKTMALAYPICISQIAHMMVGIADTVFVGKLGVNELAAAALSNSIFIVVLVFGIGISMGITPLVAAADGKKDSNEISGLLKNSLLTCFLAGVFLFILLFLITPVLKYLNQPERVIELAVPFLDVQLFSMVPLMVFVALKQFAEGLSFTKQSMYISVGSNILNIILNYTLIYGKFGFPEMGFMGSAWATFYSRIWMALAMVLFIWFNPIFKNYRKGLIPRNYSFSMIKKMFSLGIPVGLQFVFEVAAFAFAAVMIGWIGANELASHQIALSMASITYMVASGIAAAASVRVGNKRGRLDHPGLRMAGFSAMHLVMLVMAFFGLSFVLLNEFLPYLFINDPEVILLTSSLLIIAGIFQISDGVQCVGMGILRGLEDVKFPTMVALIAYWMIGLPAGYLLAFKAGMGIFGIWYGLTLGLTIAAILLFRRFNHLTANKAMLFSLPQGNQPR